MYRQQSSYLQQWQQWAGSRFAVGLMSGTSLDGVDAVLVEIKGAGEATKVRSIGDITYPISPRLREMILKNSREESANVREICGLNMALGKLYSDAVTELLKSVNFPKSAKLDFIASHGQTIYHIPQQDAKAEPNPFIPASSLQIGDPSFLALTHKTDVYFNFRMMDIAGGGDGAPLVPFTEFLLYRSGEKSRLLQNIGGIGNVTYLPANATLDALFAFDTGPGNMMINAAMMALFQKPFDKDGEKARQGRLIPELFARLKEDDYLAENPPKSTGRERYGEDVTEKWIAQFKSEKGLQEGEAQAEGIRAEDFIHTFTRFTAFTIVESYRRFILPKFSVDEVIIGGGGAYNPTLLAMIREELATISPAISAPITLLTNEDLGISSDTKEAIAFALLGNQAKHGLASNAPTATGAQYPLILGQIAPNPFPTA